MRAKRVMIQATGFGTGTGKSFLVALLCRIFKEDGYKVAPFKALNLTGVTYLKNKREFGYSQVLQCQAAGIEPDWRTNPFTIKPKGNGLFDIILEGKCIEENYDPERSFIKEILKEIVGFKKENKKIKEAILKCFDSLSEEFDFIVCYRRVRSGKNFWIGTFFFFVRNSKYGNGEDGKFSGNSFN